MNSIKIIDLINEKNAINSKDGNIVFEKLKPFIESGQEVNVDFIGVDLVLSAFLNPAIGQLYYLYDKFQIDSLLHYDNLMDVDRETLEIVIENALNKKQNKASLNEGLIDGQ